MLRYRGLIIVAILIFVVGYVAAPVVALAGLLNSLKKADSEALGKYVDFPAVRSSMKEQVSALMMSDPEMVKNPFALALGPTIINNMIDNMITPSGLTALITQGKANPSQNSFDMSKIDLQNIDMKKVAKALDVRSLFEFRLAPTDNVDQNNPQFVFKNAGVFDWKLVDVRVPPGALSKKSAQ